jgi:hypothetical protein
MRWMGCSLATSSTDIALASPPPLEQTKKSSETKNEQRRVILLDGWCYVDPPLHSTRKITCTKDSNILLSYQ